MHPSTTGGTDPSQYLSAGATSSAIDELVVLLSEIRAQSHPDVFQRTWDERIGRLEELEQTSGSQGRVQDGVNNEPADEHAQNTPTDRPQNQNSLDATSWLPGALQANPSPHRPLSLQNPPPTAMAVYISTSPVTDAAYAHRSYIWHPAPVSPSSRSAFFAGIVGRVAKLRSQDVRGWVFSYSWDDMCRWIQNDENGIRSGWEVFQNDLLRAAAAGVAHHGEDGAAAAQPGWRMKVLVVGNG